MKCVENTASIDNVHKISIIVHLGTPYLLWRAFMRVSRTVWTDTDEKWYYVFLPYKNRTQNPQVCQFTRSVNQTLVEFTPILLASHAQHVRHGPACSLHLEVLSKWCTKRMLTWAQRSGRSRLRCGKTGPETVNVVYETCDGGTHSQEG